MPSIMAGSSEPCLAMTKLGWLAELRDFSQMDLMLTLVCELIQSFPGRLEMPRNGNFHSIR